MINIKYTFRLSLILIIVLFSACESRDSGKVPDGIIPESNMISIMVDLHIVDATISTKHFNLRGNNKKIAKYYNYVLKKHGYDRVEFNKSVRFYSKNPERFDKMYDKVIEKLSKKQETIKN